MADDPSFPNPDETEACTPLDLSKIELLLGVPSDEDTVFADYLTHVANDGLKPYKILIQYSETQGGKPGESLYTHVLNGVLVLNQVRQLVKLNDDETRVLFTAFTIHDINKVDSEKVNYLKLTNRERVAEEITRLKLDCFFPGYDTYLDDIISLMQRHSGHSWVGVQAFDLRYAERFKLGGERLNQLVFLMRAADAIDLSHTLDEQRHKNTFLINLNNVSDIQYTFVTHRVAEQRGSFTNIVHNAAMEEMQARFSVTPLLLYPEGVAYLSRKGQPPTIDETIIMAIAQRVAETINAMTSAGFQQFIRPMNMGITVDKKCLELNLPFGTLLNAIYTIIQRRGIKADKVERLAADSIKRTRALLAKRAAPGLMSPTPQIVDGEIPDMPGVAAEIEARLAAGPVPTTPERMRIGELIRSYYIFLIEHLTERIPHAWEHIYAVLDVPPERRVIFNGFDARMDRAYALATELSLSESDVFNRIKEDGTAQLADQQTTDPRLPVLMSYVQHVLTFSDRPRSAHDFAASLPTYVRQQHKQCVQCSLPLPTQKWGSGNVRSDIKVQMFSNRLGGGPGEPVKRVCDICMIQFLVEKLNYREIRGEQTIYLHLFPYSFMTAPLLNGLRTTISQINATDVLAGALRLNDVSAAIIEIVNKRSPKLKFTTRTKADKAQPYGLYLPRYSDTLGGVMTFPLNPAGENDTEKFLFTLQHALLLHHHFGCKVLISVSATPPLDKDAFGDLYVDVTPLSARGLVRQNDNHTYHPGTKKPGSLRQLWQQLESLLLIRSQVATAKSDPVAALVRAMADHPLRIFYVAEKLAEAKSEKGSAGWLIAEMADRVRELALSIGEPDMNQLDEQLRRLADIARKGNLRGSSWKKSSMITALDEVLRKMSLQSDELSPEVLQAAATEDMYDHIARTRKLSGYQAGRNVRHACETFVRTFFEGIFYGVYGGKTARLLNHEKVLRSAYHFYLQQEYRKQPLTATEEQATALTIVDSAEA